MPPRIVLPFLCALACISGGAAQAPRSLAVTHITLIDGSGRPPISDTTVVIAGERIARLRPSTRVPIPSNAEVIDGTGKFMIPGLADMHVHLGGYVDGSKAMTSMLAQGITRIRDMASPLNDVLRLRQDVLKGTMNGPRILAGGPILQGPLPFQAPMLRTVASSPEAVSVVRELASAGVDFIKVGETLNRDTYFAVLEGAHQQRLHVAGHLPPSVSALEASKAGQRTIEHFGSARFHGVLIACSSEEVELRAIAERALELALKGGPSPDDTLLRAEFIDRLLATFSTAKASALFTEFAKRGMWQVPTLGAIKSVWDAQKELSSRDIEARQNLWAKYGEITLSMKRAGVKFLAGSDLPASDVAPLHEELVLLVEAGLTPMEALQAATRNPAAFIDTRPAGGTLEEGSMADVVVLEGNPLEDIRNTRRISQVIRRGTRVP